MEKTKELMLKLQRRLKKPVWFLYFQKFVFFIFSSFGLICAITPSSLNGIAHYD